MEKISIKIKMAILCIVFFISFICIELIACNLLQNFKSDVLKTMEGQLRSNYDREIKEQVENACSMLQSVYDNSKARGDDIEQSKKEAADYLRNLRYGKDGYFWADDTKGNNIVLLGKDVEGTNRLEAKDGNGYEMIKEILKQGQQPDGGYTNYVFPKNGSSDNFPKRSYSLEFQPFGWVIGTGNYIDNIDSDIKSEAQQINKKLTTIYLIMLIFDIIMLPIIIVLVILIVRGILRPLSILENVAQNIASGNFDAKADIQSKDEIGNLASSMREMADELQMYENYINETAHNIRKIGRGELNIKFRYDYSGHFSGIRKAFENTATMLTEVVKKIRNTAAQVDEGAKSLSSGSQSLSQGTVEQASSIDTLTSTIIDMSGRLNESANMAIETRDDTVKTGQAINKINVDMQQLISSMNEISHKSKEISKINKAIDDIAFQTNILALNAAVEAARAGAAGKGFAVVAEEVRNLAVKSSEAAGSTAHLIEETVKAVENGVSIANNTAGAMEDIVQASSEVMSRIETISEAIRNEAGETNNIKTGAEQIADVVSNSAATAEESAAASEELSAQADLLRGMVNNFVLADE